MAQKLARVVSAIQPSGIPHLGNYFGALAQWVEISKTRTIREAASVKAKTQEQCDDGATSTNETSDSRNCLVSKCDKPIFFIADIHAITSPLTKFDCQFYEKIFDTTAALLALGLTPENCILYKQSHSQTHGHLATLLQRFVGNNELSRMTQYKDKRDGFVKKKFDVPNSLHVYPVLQAADILLHDATHVPIGADQAQHIELTREIARDLNRFVLSEVFIEPKHLFSVSTEAHRIKSLRDPAKKMSKSDADQRSYVEIVAEPEIIQHRISKALTDCESRVYYDPNKRSGVANLMRIHHLTTGETFEQIENDASGLDTGEYKRRLADILVEKFKPVREEFKRLREARAHLAATLRQGHDQVEPIHRQKRIQVERALGLYTDEV